MASVDNGNYISDMIITIPDGTDFVSTIDDSVREVKKEIKQSFPNINKQTTITSDELNNLKAKWVYTTNQWSASSSTIVNVSAADNNSAVEPRSYNDSRYAMLGKNLADIPDKNAAVTNLFGSLAPSSPGMAILINTIGSTLYPVGTIYTSLNGTNPRNIFGFGTWGEFAPGRVIIGVGTGVDTRGDARFFGSNYTGGEYAHVLTEVEMPAHTHTFLLSGDRSNTGRADGGSTNSLDGSQTTNSTGGNYAHNIMQPYIGAYYFVRVA